MSAPTSLNITTVTARLVPELIEACIQRRRPYFLIGAPGIGKTDMVRQTLARMELEMLDVRGATMDPVDGRGVPYVDVSSDGQHWTRWARPEMWPTEGCGNIFFDEFNRSIPQVQNALMQVIHERAVAGHRIGDGWSMGAAGNDVDKGIHAMSDAMKDRFTFFNVVVDNDAWSKWAIQSGKIEPVVIAFLHFQPHLLSAHTKDALVNPTPRSWETASGYIADRHPSEVQHALLAGTVGEEAAVKFAAFEPVYLQMPTVDSILANPMGATVPGTDNPGLRVAIASALAFRADDENIGNVLAYLGRLPGEYAGMAMTDAVNRDASISHTREYAKWASENNVANVR